VDQQKDEHGELSWHTDEGAILCKEGTILAEVNPGTDSIPTFKCVRPEFAEEMRIA
jgi:hypothetical protein